MKHVKRTRFATGLSVFLSSILLITALTACGSASTNAGSTTSPGGIATPNTKAKGALPIVDKPLTLTMFYGLDATQRATMKNLNDNAAIKEMEKRTGIHIDFIHPDAGAAGANQFNLMIASGNYPDMILYPWTLYPGGPAKALSDGVIIDLKDMIDKNAPNLKKTLAQYPDARKQITTDDGKMFVFPDIAGDLKSRTALGPIVRKDWLDKFGLPIPKTVDDWHTMLKAFKEKDPNGNGKADEIPMSAGKNNVMQTLLMGMGMTMDWYQVDGKVQYGPIQPEFKEYLKVVSQWYKEGLIDPDYMVTDSKTTTARITGNITGAFESYLSRFKTYTDAMKSTNPNVQFVGVPYPTMKAGETPLMYQQVSVVDRGTGIAITSKNKHVEETVKWLDYFYSDEGQKLINFGIQGDSYTDSNGQIALADKIVNSPDKQPIQNAMAPYGFLFVNWPTVRPAEYLKYITNMPDATAAAALWTSHPNNRILPPIAPSADDASKFNNIMGGITTYVQEMYNKFVIGQEPLDNYDSFVRKLKDMGIDDATGIMQKALDAYNKR